MDINLPLILFLATVITGFFCLVDLFILRKERLTTIADTEAQFTKLNEVEKQNDVGYTTAMAAAEKEPLVVEYSKSFFPVLALVFVVRSFLFEPFQIPSESMLPALEVGDFIVVNKYKYGIRLPIVQKKVINISDPKRGDVMVFFPPHDERYFIKRVIGLPGDKISYINHQLFINDEVVESNIKFDEPAKRGEPCYSAFRGVNKMVEETIGDRTFMARKCSRPGDLSLKGTWFVPEGFYFMIGDNRDNSRDSRDWGFVPEENIVGKAVGKWMHWDGFFSLPSFDRVGEI